MGTLCLSGAALLKAGANVSSSLTEDNYDQAIEEAESTICAITRYNWMNVYATLNADVKYILQEVCSNLAGIYLLNYDMSGITMDEAQTRLNVLIDGALRGLSVLRDRKVQDFINGA